VTNGDSPHVAGLFRFLAERWVLDDPRGIPYIFLWRREWESSGKLVEWARVARYVPRRSVIGETEYVERIPAGEEWASVTQPEGGGVHAIRVLRVALPRRGGSALLLVCPYCDRPRRHLYAWAVTGSGLYRMSWRCRTCAGLRYGSEGTYIRPRWRCLGGYPRLETWDPYVFASLEEGARFLRAWVGTRA